MNVRELESELVKRGLRPNAVSFRNGVLTAPEQYCIAQNGPFWEVYYYERGNKNSFQQFVDEKAACDYLLSKLLRDKTVWSHASA
jgi:hypothetical protein